MCALSPNTRELVERCKALQGGKKSALWTKPPSVAESNSRVELVRIDVR